VQRLTAMALIPLAIWFAVSVVRMSTASQAAAAAWLAWPVNAVIMALFIVIALRHAVIGLQIILEDYVHHEGLRAVCVLVVKAIGLLLGVGAVAALIHLAL
jgi:succinate dehydrogenase / fumarate reductase membrane anchor subunit